MMNIQAGRFRRSSKAAAVVIGVAMLYVLPAGFVLAPVENHMHPGFLKVVEVVYAPLIALHRVCPPYRRLIDWEDGVATKW